MKNVLFGFKNGWKKSEKNFQKFLKRLFGSKFRKKNSKKISNILSAEKFWLKNVLFWLENRVAEISSQNFENLKVLINCQLSALEVSLWRMFDRILAKYSFCFQSLWKVVRSANSVRIKDDYFTFDQIPGDRVKMVEPRSSYEPPDSGARCFTAHIKYV